MVQIRGVAATLLLLRNQLRWAFKGKTGRTPMRDNWSILYDKSGLETFEALATAVQQVREYFSSRKLPEPPLPENLLPLVPCNLTVFERKDALGATRGKMQFLSLRGDPLYEADWEISPST